MASERLQDRIDELDAQAEVRRARLESNLPVLVERLKPRNLWNEGVDRVKNAAWSEVDRVTDEAIRLVEDLVQDSMSWAGANRKYLGTGAAVAMAAAVGMWMMTRRKTVPLYAAYGMEEPWMAEDGENGMKARAADAWGKVKGDAGHLGEKAGEAYGLARARAADLAEDARERAQHAADVAREKAAEAAAAAFEAAEKARDAAGDARRWAGRQPAEHPATVVVAALAAGALIGALLPSGRRRG